MHNQGNQTPDLIEFFLISNLCQLGVVVEEVVEGVEGYVLLCIIVSNMKLVHQQSLHKLNRHLFFSKSHQKCDICFVEIILMNFSVLTLRFSLQLSKSILKRSLEYAGDNDGFRI